MNKLALSLIISYCFTIPFAHSKPFNYDGTYGSGLVAFTVVSLQTAIEGTPESYYLLGGAYEFGIGTDVNMTAAIKAFEKAADLGSLKALEKLGYIYHYSKNYPHDYQKAFNYYELAIKRNSAEAYYGLGTLFLHGKGVDQDAIIAERYIRKSAEAGFPEAQLALSIFYDRGFVVPKDKKMAKYWSNEAEKQGVSFSTRQMEYSIQK
ncbi:tetratricopeptide repeat protein [Providencia stuartii]|uniref:tetratricopeptide repeat protein n=1 Tax=Providencia stuartii TaxID=588 RepID=UPI0018C61B26|nr:tetratricopeptide repeat protein [Providencia stuartii]EMD1718778.1 sel1 repeat family protein [Providencia stuartii]MBG5908521.1 sel1 repeat family protein [Providencia stuartii]WAZ73455.1 tetratricopeptide repeat protein [Providencia stuartii]HAU5735778.1 sel1 repeat family protein [Providencia stuartii]HAU5776206.1 sel1 repeat family protein [Providencia stuartii]